MHPFVILGLISVALITGLIIGTYIKPLSRSGLTFVSYNCATKSVTVDVSVGMNLYLDALDNTSGNAVQPAFPRPEAIAVPNVLGYVTLGPLAPQNNAEKVLICIWAISKVGSWERDCSESSSSSSSSIHPLSRRKFASQKKSVLP